MSDPDCTYWRKVGYWFLHFSALQLFALPWLVLESLELISPQNRCPWFGLIILFPIGICGTVGLARGAFRTASDKGGGFLRNRELINSPHTGMLGAFAICLIVYPGLQFAFLVRCPARIPIIDRFLDLREAVSVVIACTVFVYYSSFYLCRNVFYWNKCPLPRQRLSRSIAMCLLYFPICLLICACCVAASLVLTRLSVLAFGFAGAAAAEEVSREVGPGFSRRLPYGIALAFAGIFLLLFNLFMFLIVPAKASFRALTLLKERLCTK